MPFAAACAAAVPAAAQAPSAPQGPSAPQAPSPLRGDVSVGSEAEAYLRALQLAGVAPVRAWSIRPAPLGDLDRWLPAAGVDHPWAQRHDMAARRDRPAFEATWIMPSLRSSYNSGFVWGANDGAVWQGRGINAWATGGVALRWGPLALRLQPVAFRAENRPVPLRPVLPSVPTPFGFPDDRVDYPQRFGDWVYDGVDLGQSELRLDTRWLSLGASNANIGWGPGGTHNSILGPNAAGFPHVFGIARVPVPAIARVNVHYFAGALRQSAWSPVTGSRDFVDLAQPGRRRVTTGVQLLLEPYALPGLELGVATMLHQPWRTGEAFSRSTLTQPFRSLYKRDLEEGGAVPFEEEIVNQLATIHARWVFPAAGLELAGEYFRDDNSADLRDLLLEPESNGGFTVAVRKLLRRSGDRLLLARFELVNNTVQPLGQQRPQGGTYMNGGIRQGHTQLGQLLGTAIAPGAFAGQTIGIDRWHRTGRWTIEYTRQQRELRVPLDPQTLNLPAPIFFPDAFDVLHAIGGELVRFRGRYDWFAGATLVLNTNRDLLGATRTNLQLRTGIRLAR